MEVAPRYILLTLFTQFVLFKLLYTALTVACMHKNVVTVGLERYWKRLMSV